MQEYTIDTVPDNNQKPMADEQKATQQAYINYYFNNGPQVDKNQKYKNQYDYWNNYCNKNLNENNYTTIDGINWRINQSVYWILFNKNEYGLISFDDYKQNWNSAFSISELGGQDDNSFPGGINNKYAFF